MELIRAERIVIKPSHVNHAACKRYCGAARRVYNAALYQMRQALFSGAPISASQADKVLKQTQREIYQLLPSAGAQRTTQVLGDNWKGWLAAKRDYEKHPQKYTSRPKLPNYARAAKTYVVGRNGHKIEQGRLFLAGGKDFGFQPLKVTCCQSQPYNSKASETIVNDVRIMPLGTVFVIELVYRKKVEPPTKLNPDNAFGIDLGINNLVTIVSTQQDYAPVLIKGKAIKSINAKYNKLKAQLARNGKHGHIKAKSRRRYSQISDYFHKASHWLIKECLRTDTGKVVIGLNAGWKQAMNIGRVNNQKFCAIPHRRLLDMIHYKGARHGIEVVIREESYTSKASCLDLDSIPDYQAVKGGKVVPLFSGRRVKRGLYKTGSGALLNSDVNGAANILRKEIGDDWLISQIEAGKGVMDTPVAVKHIDQLLEAGPRPRETMSNREAA
ncbi:MAG TPA: transposase [Paenalcaligenes sp.]|nr:transposase [Paenalcaligenes sp.]